MTIARVLVANRGEIAVRVIRTLKTLGIGSVAVFHAVDTDSPAVSLADEAVELTGDLPVAAYLDIDQIIAAAKSSAADAVHPGFGFLAENAQFVTRVAEEGLVFIGPSADNIALMGNKIRARAFCLEHGFPLAPSVVDEEDDTRFFAAAREIGAPLLIKAAAGGGGKGMQIVRDIADLESTVALARNEAERSFGDSLVYAERLVETPRHIEVQVLADQHGNIIHLGERECSIQRRFQKIIEEAPSPAIDDVTRRKICETGVAIARAAGYVNAGTVEFIYAPNGEFYFLEMNTRIQVEHPVTEMITGIDLVEQQIRIAEGDELALSQNEVAFNGHALEVRLYAENPENEFAPATGSLLVYDLPEQMVRIDNGTSEGQRVSASFDPMLAKLIAHGDTRAQAVSKALEALNASSILGVQTNRDFLIRILSHPAFAAGNTHTGFLAEHGGDLALPSLADGEIDLLLAAAALSTRDFNDDALQPPQPHASMGDWKN